MFAQTRWMIVGALTASLMIGPRAKAVPVSLSQPLGNSTVLTKPSVALYESRRVLHDALPNPGVNPSVDPVIVSPQAPDSSSIKSEVIYNLDLHDSRQVYQLSFSGRASCGGYPCEETEIMVTVQMRGQTDIEEKTLTQPDGRFHLEITAQALPDEQLDWTITAGGHGAAQETSGRRILTDVTQMTIQRDIVL